MRNTLSLMAVSFLALFYELIFIRWLPANITSIAYFSNLVLIASFFGLGLGCLIPRGRCDLFNLFPPLLTAGVGLLVLFRNLGVAIPSQSGEWIWSGYTHNIVSLAQVKIGLIPTLVLVYLLTAALFAPLGQKMAALMSLFPPLRAYTINICGSLLGILAFTLFSLGYTWSGAPLSWFVLASALTWPLLDRTRFWRGVGAVSALALWGLVFWSAAGERWSPYYVIQTKDKADGALAIYVNKFFHQEALNFERNPDAARKYGTPYRLKQPARLLILGAGSGNDAAVAIAEGVPEMEVVEIDPEIYRLGKDRHPQRPYDHPAVRPFIDDARSFLKKTDRTYDMIVLGTLDSHALLSSVSNIRLDNFVYTAECLRDMRRCLTADGVVVLLFSVPTDWLRDKLIVLTREAFPGAAYYWRARDAYLFNLMLVAGPGAPRAIEALPAEQAAQYFPLDRLALPPVEIPTDDWPYLYLSGRGIPRYYLYTIAWVLALSGLAVFWALPRRSGRRSDLAFFFLGAAFLLLETKSVTTLSLLFGSTWIVNAAVFLAILLMILLANLTALRLPAERIGWPAALLGASLALNYVLPMELFLHQPFWVKSLAPALTIALPLYFAGLLFAQLFRRVTHVPTAYAANLMGCVVGGFLEYGSMVVGLQPLFLLAGVCYGLALLCARERQPD